MSGGRDDPSIKLDQFLKWQGLVGTGGEAKQLVQAGAVLVNGTVETRRSRRLRTGDRVQVHGIERVVAHLQTPNPDEPHAG